MFATAVFNYDKNVQAVYLITIKTFQYYGHEMQRNGNVQKIRLSSIYVLLYSSQREAKVAKLSSEESLYNVTPGASTTSFEVHYR